MPGVLVSYAYKKKPIGIQLDKTEWFIRKYAYSELQDYIVNGKLTWGGYHQLCSVFDIHPIDYQNYNPDFQYALFFPNHRYLAVDIDVPNPDVDLLPLLLRTGINPDTNLIERSASGGYHIYAENIWKLGMDIGLNDTKSRDDLAYLFGTQPESVEVFGNKIENYHDLEKIYGTGCKWGFEIKTKNIIAYNSFLNRNDYTNISSSTYSAKPIIQAIMEIHEKHKNETDPIRFYNALEYPLSLADITDYLDEKGIWWKQKNGYIQLQCPFHEDSQPSAAMHEFKDIMWFKCFTEDLVYTAVEFITKLEGSESAARNYLEKYGVGTE